MSDGPHRSLPMRKAWKKVAEWADNRNFDHGQVAELVFQAVVKDFRKEVPDQTIALLRSEFERMEGCLFPNYRTQLLSDSGGESSGFAMYQLLLDCADYELAVGRPGNQGFIDSVESCVREWMQRMARQVEEHYIRKSTRARAINVRDRIQQAIQQVPTAKLARQALGLQPFHSSRFAQYSGVDEGVPIE